MQLKSIATVAGLFAATAVLPLPAASHTPKSCTAGEPTSASSTWNFAKEGSELLQAVQEDAYDILNSADRLVSFDKSPSLSWQSHAVLLGDIREQVNDMGKNLCRLEAIRHTLPEWQQNAIARTEVAVIEMANYTTQALKVLNARQDRWLGPEFTQYAQYLSDKAGQLSTSLANFEKYGRVSGEEARLEQTLGLKKSD